MKNIVDQIEEAIELVLNGHATQYLYANGKTIRVSDHGANPQRVDDNTYSIVCAKEGQSYSGDRGRLGSTWERSNQFYVNESGSFIENFDSVESFVEYHELDTDFRFQE